MHAEHGCGLWFKNLRYESRKSSSLKSFNTRMQGECRQRKGVEIGRNINCTCHARADTKHHKDVLAVLDHELAWLWVDHRCRLLFMFNRYPRVFFLPVVLRNAECHNFKDIVGN